MKKLLCIGILGAALLSLTGCDEKTGQTPEATPTAVITAEPTKAPTPTPFVPVQVGFYEAEEAELTGKVTAKTGDQTYTGTGYVDGFQGNDDSCIFHINIEEAGFYDLSFRMSGIGGEKYNDIVVDETPVGSVHAAGTELETSALTRIYLEAGEHTVTLKKNWGWINLDSLAILTSEPIDPAMYQVSKELSNPNASDTTKRLFSYLADIYGKNILSGQVCDEGINGKEFMVIRNTTGKTPAILGLDLIEYTPSRVERGSSSKMVEFATAFWEAGGIVEVHWHWNAPSKYLTGQWYSGFYEEYTNIDLKKIMNGEDQEGYDLLMADIDAIATQLLRLKEADVPILFRPLHEASGGWFWWGASGADAYLKLYKLLYDRLTNEYGLDNLIWVWNGQAADWYPGDEYVDIIGQDIYPGERVYSSQAAKFLEVASWSTENKMVYLTECGCIFDPELAYRDGAMWGMWAVWQGEFVRKDIAFVQLSEQYTEKDMMIKAYNDERVLTLDELPDFSTYPME